MENDDRTKFETTTTESITADTVRDLPLGISTFSAIRKQNRVYVDKTDMIYSMLRKYPRLFLSRPRRFGKSLLVSILDELFSNGIKSFKGLKIEKLWQQRPLFTEDEKFRVVRLDFSAIKDDTNITDMRADFDLVLKDGFSTAGFSFDANRDGTCVSQLSFWLSKQPFDIVLLMDEYDAPLNNHLHEHRFFKDIRDMMSGFFTVIKIRDGAFRQIFMTGIAKFSKVSVFSTTNQLEDISMSPEFGTLLGYTEEELKENFGWYLQRSADVRHETVEEMLPKMQEMYDGFCFDRKAATHVYAPWSVLRFLSEASGDFDNYWIDSAGNSAIMRTLMNKGDFVKPVDTEKKFSASLIDLKGSQSAEEFNPVVLMFQSGYLAIKEVNGDTGVATLGYPNGEVEKSMALLRTQIFLNSTELDFVGINKIAPCLRGQDVNGVVECFNSYYAAIPYDHYPVNNESICRGMLYSLLVGLQSTVLAERHNYRGRSDLEILTGYPHAKGTIHWVFELKYVQDSKEADAKLSEAVQQLQERDYGNPKMADTLIRVALVFDAGKRQIVRTEVVN